MFNSPSRLSPLYEVTRALGASFAHRSGWQMARSYANPEGEAEAARRAVALADVSPAGKVTVEGERAAGVLESVWGAAVPSVGAGAILPDQRLFRLREDFFLVWAGPGGEVRLVAELAGALERIQGLVTVTDATHGRAAVRLVGPASPALLSRTCGLDFGPAAFPNLAIRASSVAKTPAWVFRDDLGGLPSFVVMGARSLGAYLWEVLLEAGRDLEAQPLGQAALDALSGDLPG